MKKILYLSTLIAMFTIGIQAKVAQAENNGEAASLPMLTKSYAETFMFAAQHGYYPWLDVLPQCNPMPCPGHSGGGGTGGPFPLPHVPMELNIAPDGGKIVSGDLCIDHYLEFDKPSMYWCTSINGTLSYDVKTREGEDELLLRANDGSSATISRSVRTGGIFSVKLDSAQDYGSWYWNTTTLRLKNQQLDVSDEKVVSIGIEEVYGAFNGGENILFIDTREPEEFAEGHIPGAINLPLRDIKHLSAADLPAAPIIIPYCLKNFRGYEVAIHLQGMGLPVALLQDGFVGWVSGGFPIER